jgi:hypothetical protein
VVLAIIPPSGTDIQSVPPPQLSLFWSSLHHKIFFLFVIDCYVVGVDHLASAEEGILHIRYYVYASCWLLQLVPKLVHCMLPKAPPKLVFDCMPVGIVGAIVSLAADGMLPSRTPLHSSSFRSRRSLLPSWLLPLSPPLCAVLVGIVGWEREMHLIPLLVRPFDCDRWGHVCMALPCIANLNFWTVSKAAMILLLFLLLLLCRLHEDLMRIILSFSSLSTRLVSGA